MLTKDKLFRFLLELEPESDVEFKLPDQLWENRCDPHSDMRVFTSFVITKIENGSFRNAQRVFKALESLLMPGAADTEVQNAICTMFLEGVINYFSYKPEFFPAIIPFLGPLSKKHVRGVDEFHGVYTPGLWSQPQMLFSWLKNSKRRWKWKTFGRL